MTRTLSELAETIDARLIGDGTRRVVACAPIDKAKPNEVTFLANAKYGRFLESTTAAAVIVGPDIEQRRADDAKRNGSALGDLNFLVAKDPYFAFRRAIIELHGIRQHLQPIDCVEGSLISERAVVHPSANVAESAIVHPFVVIEENARVGERCVIYPGAYLGPEVRLGEACLSFPGVAIYEGCSLGDRVTVHANTVIGNDGFGYATHGGQHHKIPQHGIVVLEDDVEIGACCSIERAAMGETRIGKGTKFADLISFGHGARMGANGLVVSLVGVAGSVEIGDNVAMGGQVGISGHITIGDNVQIAGKAAVLADVPSNIRVGGVPAIELHRAKRNALAGTELAEMAKRLRQLEERVLQLDQHHK